MKQKRYDEKYISECCKAPVYVDCGEGDFDLGYDKSAVTCWYVCDKCGNSCNPVFKKRIKVLVACEYSGVVREAFCKLGVEAMSCDLLASEQAGWHYTGDVMNVINDGWDLMIAHPPCTHLAVSGARWFKNKEKEQKEALEFVQKLMNAPIKYIAIENPISIISSKIRKPDQVIQPWQFGHGETKATCLWLKNLPKLKPTNIVSGREQRIWKLPPSPERAKIRGKTFQGIADAMASQWLQYILEQED